MFSYVPLEIAVPRSCPRRAASVPSETCCWKPTVRLHLHRVLVASGTRLVTRRVVTDVPPADAMPIEPNLEDGYMALALEGPVALDS